MRVAVIADSTNRAVCAASLMIEMGGRPQANNQTSNTAISGKE
jgi:hypothetical protein